MHADEEVIDIPILSASDLEGATFEFNYVVMEDGTVRMSRIFHEGHHSLSGGAKQVQAAGIGRNENGIIKWLDNDSGHFNPSGAEAERNAMDAFSRAGFAVERFIHRF